MNKLKSFVAFLLFCVPFIANAQNINFVIKGKVGRYSLPAKAYLSYLVSDDHLTRDSASITNGVFTFKGSVPYPVETSLTIKPDSKKYEKNSIKIYLEPGIITVNSPDSLENATVIGGQINTDNEKIKVLLRPVEAKKNRLRKAYTVASADEKRIVEMQMDSLNIPKRAIYLKFIKVHTDHMMSLIALKLYGGYNPTCSDVEPLFNTLSADIKQSRLGIAYAAELKKLSTIDIGAVAPDFTQNDTTGKPVSLHDFKGKYVFIDFWASWCHSCREENPDVVGAYKKFKGKGLNVLGISLDVAATKQAWTKAIITDNLTWAQGSDLKGFDNKAAKLYAVGAIPQNFLIGPDGKIIAKDLHGEYLDKTLSQIFK